MEHAEAEAPAQAEAPVQGSEGAEGAEEAQEAAPVGEVQGGRAKGEVVTTICLDDPNVVQALKSLDGKLCVARDGLKQGLTAAEAQLVWDFGMQQHALAVSTRRVMSHCMRDMATVVRGHGEREDAFNGADLDGEDSETPQTDAYAPIQDALAMGDAYLPFGDERWQRKRISQKGILRKLTSKFAIEIVEDVRDADGRPYVVGKTSQATNCGAFPHGLVKHKVGPHKYKDVYVCSCSLDIVITIRLVNNQLPVNDPKRYDVTEKDVLKDLSFVDKDERAKGWGVYENSLVFYLELQFYKPKSDDYDRYVCTDPRNEERRAFKTAPPDGKLLCPAEVRPYARGPQEITMLKGKAEAQFSFNEHVHSKNLMKEHKDNLFCITVHCLNPYLNGRTNFSAMSLPFMIKKTLHNDLVRSERWVCSEVGTPVEADQALVTRMAPARKLAFAKERKGAADKDAEAHEAN